MWLLSKCSQSILCLYECKLHLSCYRHFRLSLVVNRKLFSDQFRVYTVDNNDNYHHYHVNTEEYYHGYLHGKRCVNICMHTHIHTHTHTHTHTGDVTSTVVAHVSSTGVLSATIQTNSDLYHIEPSQHYITEPHPFHMIAYKSSHVKNRLSDALLDFEVSSPPLEAVSPVRYENKEEVKRQTGSLRGDSCPIVLVSDYTVFEMFQPESSVISRLVSVGSHDHHVTILILYLQNRSIWLQLLMN